MATFQKNVMCSIESIHPHDLAKHLHADDQYVLLDCRPVLAYNSCHISGAVNVNFTSLMKKRFIAGKIGLADLMTTEEGRQRFRSSTANPTIVYDEDTCDIQKLNSSNSLSLVIVSLTGMGRIPYLLQGGLSEFGVLHPSLCEISVPVPRPKSSLPPPLRASTPGMRDQALDWQTAPPVHVLSFLILGSEKDAKSEEVFDWFNIRYVLNVTPSCPNRFEGKGVNYKRIPVSDTGTQKLSNKFEEAFQFIEEARKNNAVILIHCMAGISRSVTLTIAYIMAHFNLTMQNAYQYVKDKRPAISPNLNFMGQLVEFEQQCAKKIPTEKLDISTYFPTKAQLDVSAKLMEKIIRTGSTSSLSGTAILESPKVKDQTDSNPAFFQPFVLKPLNAGGRRKKLKEGTTAAVMSENTKPIISVDSTEEGVAKSTVTETPSDIGFPRGRSTLPNQVDSSSPSNINICTSTSSTVESLEIESQLKNESLPSSREGTPTKQLMVLSVKGERLTLKTRDISNTSPSTSPEISSDDKECDKTRETEEDYRLHVQNN